MRPSWFKISALLTGLWLVVGSTVWWLDSRRPSAEKVLAFIATQKPQQQPDAARLAQVDAVVSQYHQLEFDQRPNVLIGEEMKAWWGALTKNERRELRMRMFPQARQFVEFLDKLPIQQRERDLSRMMEEARKKGGAGIMAGANPAMLKTVTIMGLKPIFESTMLDDNMDALLLLHELEKRSVWRRRM